MGEEAKFQEGDSVRILRSGPTVIGTVLKIEPHYRYLVLWNAMEYASLVPEEKLEHHEADFRAGR